MSLKAKIEEDFKKALKEKREIEVSTLRMLNAAIINKEKEKRYKLSKKKPEFKEKDLEKESLLTDEKVIEVVSSEIKKRKEALILFEKGERKDLAEREKREIEVLEKYLPEQLSEEEIKKLAKEVIEKIDAKEPKDYNPPATLQGKNIYGKVMAELMPKVKARAEGGVVSRIVKELLQR